jgi:hypothetical protein
LHWKWEEYNSFECHLENWILQYNKKGSFPNYNSKDALEKKSAHWQTHIRYAYKKNLLHQDRIDQCNAIPYWKWNRND